jgi:protein-glutamine gamma-glutamyltransferase
MKSDGLPSTRFLAVVPLVTAIIFHAVALERWLLAIPVLLGLVAFVVRDFFIPLTLRMVYVAIGIGLVAGLVLPVANVTSGVLPAVVIGAITGVLVCVAVLNVFVGSWSITWGFAWAIVTFSASVPMTRMVSISLFVFLMTSIVLPAWQIGLFQFRIRAIVQLGVLIALISLATAGIAAVARRVDSVMLMSAHLISSSNSSSSMTGLSDNLLLQSRNTITLTHRPVLDLSRMPGYLRTKVLDDFDGWQWSTSSRLSNASHVYSEALERDGLVNAFFEMVFLTNLGDVLPAPAGTRQIDHATFGVAGGWIPRGIPDSPTIEIFGNHNEWLPEESEPTPNDVALPNDLKEQLGPLAAQLTESAETNITKAGRIEAFFRNHFAYSLETDLAGEAHPLVIMINERRPAYCVYFASAMAVMLRSQGVASRVVSGFAPSEVNRLTGRVTVRDRDAHAWVEVWSPEQSRYVAFDPTPHASRMEAIGHEETSGLFTSVVAATRSLLRRIWITATNDPIRLLRTFSKSPMIWAICAACIFFVLKRYRKRSVFGERIERDAVDPVLHKAYSEYVRSLKQAGITPKPWETDEEIIERLAASELSSLSEKAKQFIHNYRASRFGGAPFVHAPVLHFVDKIET